MKRLVIRLKICLLAVFGSHLKKSDLWEQEMYGPLEMEYQENLIADEDSDEVSEADEGEKI